MLNYVDQPTRRMHNFAHAQARGMRILSDTLHVIASSGMMDSLMDFTYTNIPIYPICMYRYFPIRIDMGEWGGESTRAIKFLHNKSMWNIKMHLPQNKTGFA